jgi:hypothetical protein
MILTSVAFYVIDAHLTHILSLYRSVAIFQMFHRAVEFTSPTEESKAWSAFLASSEPWRVFVQSADIEEKLKRQIEVCRFANTLKMQGMDMEEQALQQQPASQEPLPLPDFHSL